MLPLLLLLLLLFLCGVCLGGFGQMQVLSQSVLHCCCSLFEIESGPPPQPTTCVSEARQRGGGGPSSSPISSNLNIDPETPLLTTGTKQCGAAG
jgi:hypothetical protein